MTEEHPTSLFDEVLRQQRAILDQQLMAETSRAETSQRQVLSDAIAKMPWERATSVKFALSQTGVLHVTKATFHESAEVLPIWYPPKETGKTCCSEEKPG